eukprot:6187902-Pleurochrysis_carterae.AAC.3
MCNSCDADLWLLSAISPSPGGISEDSEKSNSERPVSSKGSYVLQPWMADASTDCVASGCVHSSARGLERSSSCAAEQHSVHPSHGAVREHTVQYWPARGACDIDGALQCTTPSARRLATCISLHTDRAKGFFSTSRFLPSCAGRACILGLREGKEENTHEFLEWTLDFLEEDKALIWNLDWKVRYAASGEYSAKKISRWYLMMRVS